MIKIKCNYILLATNNSKQYRLCCCHLVQLFVTPWTAACQASLFFTISQSLLKLMSIEMGMPSNHLILCRPLLLLTSILPNIKVFSKIITYSWTKNLRKKDPCIENYKVLLRVIIGLNKWTKHVHDLEISTLKICWCIDKKNHNQNPRRNVWQE